MRHLTPTALAVYLSLAVAALIIIGGAAIGGSYALTIHTLNVAQANHINSGIQECKAIHALAHAGDGITFPKVNKAHPSETALTRIFTDSRAVYEASGCATLLKK